jgi:hypothetical protein
MPGEPQLVAYPPRPTMQKGEVLQRVAWKNKINLLNAIPIVMKQKLNNKNELRTSESTDGVSASTCG